MMRLNVANMLDLSYMVLDVLREKPIFSKYISIHISENEFWGLYLPTDLCLRRITIYEKDKILEIESPYVSLVDILEEFYNVSVKDIIDDIYTPVFKEKLLNLVKDKAPKLYKTYISDTELTHNLSVKYNVNIEKVLDPGGHTYVALKSSIEEKNVKEIADIIKRGLKAFEEYCTAKKGKFFQSIIQELKDPLNQIEDWLALVKAIYSTNRWYRYSYIELSNMHNNPYKAPYIHFIVENKVGIKIIVTQKDKYYTLNILLEKEKCKEDLIKLFKLNDFISDTVDSQLKFEKKYSDLNDIILWLNENLSKLLD